MNTTTPNRRSPKPSEEGYILVAVMFMLAILIVAMAIAAPKIAKSIQRDREVETMHRGKQYARAVKLYYKQFNTYPPNMDALAKTNEIRFLRKKYIDPTTGKDEWKVIQVGQNKVPTAYGFFGVPLTGAGMGGGLCGNAGPGSTTSGTSGGSSSSGFSSSSFGSSGSSGSTFGSSSSFGSSTPITGCAPSDTSTTGSGTSTGGTGTTDQSATNGSTDQSGANGNSTPGTGSSGTGSSNTPTANGSGTGTNSGTGLTGQTFGGGGIMGFSPNSPKQSILVYKKKNHYNEWEFVYDPIADQMMMQGGNTGAIGTPAGGMPGSSPVGSGSTFGPGGSSSFGPSGGTNPPIPAPAPPSTPPQ